jgi:hypothetical protein
MDRSVTGRVATSWIDEESDMMHSMHSEGSSEELGLDIS